MSAIDTRKPKVDAGDYAALVEKVSGDAVTRGWVECLGCRNASHAAEIVALDELAVVDDTAVVLVEDHNGKQQRFEVTMRVKSWGEMKELPA